MENPKRGAEDTPDAAESGAEPGAWRRLLLRPLQVGAVALVGGLLVLLVWRVISQQRGPDLVAAIAAGKRPQAPAFTLPLLWRPATDTWPAPLRALLAGQKLSLSQLRGHPVVVNFWASWCIPCKQEAPLLAATARAQAGKVVFLGVDVQDLESDAHTFLRAHKTNYVSVRDPSSSAYDAYGVTGVPETYYLDRSGRVVAHTPGPVTQQSLRAGIVPITRR